MIFNPREKVLANNHFNDVKHNFDELLTLEYDIGERLEEKPSVIHDDNDHEYKMLGVDPDLAGFGHTGHEKYENLEKVKDLSDLLIQYDNNLNQIFIFLENSIEKLKKEKINGIKNYYSLKIDIEILNNFKPDDEESYDYFKGNPYQLIYNKLVEYYGLFIDFYKKFDAVKEFTYLQSEVVKEGFPLSFGSFDVLKDWEELIDVSSLSIENLMSPKGNIFTDLSVMYFVGNGRTRKNSYTLKGLLKNSS